MATKPEAALVTLKAAVSNALELIARLRVFTPPTEAAIVPKHSDVNAIELGHDSAKLIRAHTTKLSLLIINKPFTASAITTVLRELVTGPLPGLASAVEICNTAPYAYTNLMSVELQYRAQRVFIELSNLLKAIPLDGSILSDDQKKGTGSVQGNGSLTATGVVWKACDALINLKEIGIAGLLIRKVDQYRELLKDALEELREWAEEESDGEDAGDPIPEVGNADHGAAQAAVDEIFGSQRHIPVGDPEGVRPRLDSVQKRLRMIILMYQAVVKRRLKTLPPLQDSGLNTELTATSEQQLGIIRCLDEVFGALKKIPGQVDELAIAFYDLDVDGIDRRMEQCFVTSVTAVEMLMEDWKGQKDEFSTWATKFQLAMKKGW